jgi:CDP-L-myo-inositol myo-inositolphosphotransferase
MSDVRHAIVVAGPADADRRVAGVPLLARTLIVLQRAGIERCTLVAAAVPADPRIRLAVVPAAALVPVGDDALHVVVGPGAVVDAPLVADLVRRARPGAVLDVEADGARVRVAPGPLVAANGVAPGPPAVGTLCSAAVPGIVRRLLRGLENPRDGYIDRALFRRGSRALTPLLLRTPLSANAVTVLGIVIGVVGGLLLGAATRAGVVAGVACLVASGTLDCCDGEIARLRLLESALGHWLDIVGDTVVHFAVIAGIALHLARAGTVPGWPVFALLGAGIVGAFVTMTWSEQVEERRRRAGGWENVVLDGVLSPLSTRDWHVFVVAFALAGRLDVLVVAGAVGAHVFWLLVAVLLVRVLGRARQVQPSVPRVRQ